ncbi:MAG: SUMF1/EgtB/PvdO family nonheme iron enzyme [Humidesulfovibrio sp.]|uniref:SUMF1/EgtB/PvdO family nonheme iron enzyme n=1 Tax=Humidesulfovibrio sp. TaxID=2910988 RepID=UPI0027FD178A|nr:SUMF1/EgtB/PvdO family nonheme iron enzyme [Humidesulfovibrio sp.]MDQ7836195.1 SUMF1/EgtB/PvdO family nonheme iron enzyme [Humidesulfovibrio sp.]
MRRSVLALLALALLLCLAAPAQAAPNAERRIALVIGNAAYPTAPLKNPVNDARDMARALRSLGFEVIARENASLAQMEGAVNEFWGKLKTGGAGLFYFAGHGLQVNGRNYLVPVDARLEAEQDTRYKCMDAGLVLGRMENAGNNLNIVILDACRNNPFARSWRSAEQGLAKMDAPKGSIIAYATAPDSVAADGVGKNGLYTEKLLQAMRTPGQPVEQMFKRVRDEVMRATKDKQVPWESTSLRGDFYFAGAGASAPAAPAPTQLALAPAPVEKPALAPLADLKQRLAGKYAEAGADTGKNGLIFDFALQGDELVGTPSGSTGGVSPVGISGVRVEGNTLAFRFTYKKGLLGMAGTTYTDYTCNLSGDLNVIPMDYLTESGNTGKARLIRLKGTGPRPMQQAMAAPPKQAPSAQAGGPTAGDTWTEPVTGMEFAWVPGGEFEMGCGPWAGECDDDEKPVHTVRLDGFWLGRFEVTQGQWQKIMGSNPSYFKKGERFPVEEVSWDDAKAFISKLNAQGSAKFRLATEAEWEYAARSGGRPEIYAGGNDIDRVAWHQQNGGRSTHAVGTKAPNGLGLHDMTGNVWEWVEDMKADYPYDSQVNPVVTGGGSGRVIRGGSWLYGPTQVRTTFRLRFKPFERYGSVGFRLVRVP